MISFEEAVEIVWAQAATPVSEPVDLHQACGRVLAQEVYSDHDMPPFNKSVMDGYACRAADLPGPLFCVESIPAGTVPKMVINTGRCAKIMTGAMIPEGADCVFIVEESEILEDNSVRFTGTDASDNIYLKGMDVKTGDVVLAAGTLLTPAHVAILAAAGCDQPIVAKCPTVGILATGSELVPPNAPVSGAAVRETSGAQLIAQVRAAGATPTYYGIAEDDPAIIGQAIERALTENDVLLICGGSSVGDFDFVPDLLKQIGLNIHFDKVAVQPGKPIAFATGNGKTCFGMPGNPVSTFMVMEAVVKPFLYRSMGHVYKAPIIRLPMAQTSTRKKTNRKAFAPARLLPDGHVEKLAYHGSAHIHAMGEADGWIIFPLGTATLEKGALVDFWKL